MTALVKIPPNEITGAAPGYWVPSAAVSEDSEGRRCVWVADKDMKARKRIVQPGIISGDRILVSSGLLTGERLVTAGVRFVSEGMPLKELNEIDGHKLGDAR